MSLLTVSLLIDGLILLVNFPALVKNEKKPFVSVQTPENQDGWAGTGGGGGAGRGLGERAGRGGRSLLIGQEARLGHAQPWVGAGTRGRRGGGARRWVVGGGSPFSVCACVPAVLPAGSGACVRVVTSVRKPVRPLSVYQCVPRCVALGVHTDIWDQTPADTECRGEFPRKCARL